MQQQTPTSSNPSQQLGGDNDTTMMMAELKEMRSPPNLVTQLSMETTEEILNLDVLYIALNYNIDDLGLPD